MKTLTIKQDPRILPDISLEPNHVFGPGLYESFSVSLGKIKLDLKKFIWIWLIECLSSDES